MPEVIESEVQKPEESDFRKVEVIGKKRYLMYIYNNMCGIFYFSVFFSCFLQESSGK